MSRQYSPRARRNLLGTSVEADVMVCLEIYHADLVEPVRVVHDTQNLIVAVNNGGTVEAVEFIACPFEITLPDDVDQQITKATLEVDNIGRELTQWLEYSRGGKGAKARILQTLRSYVQDNEPWEFGEYVTTDYASHDYVYGKDIGDFAPWEYDIVMDMSNIKIDNTKVSCELGYKGAYGRLAVALRYDPKTAPGVF